MRRVLEPGVPGDPRNLRTPGSRRGVRLRNRGHFPVPPAAWWDDYYRPLQDSMTAFRMLHHDEPDAQELADQRQHEIDIWHACSEFYGYEFLVLRVR